MNTLQSNAIVLARLDYGEADRIITVLTPDHGKLRLMAKGVRKIKSKLAGGIELFSISEISFLMGRGEIGTLVSARLRQHYSHIVADYDRLQVGYELITLINKITEDQPEAAYYYLVEQLFVGLNQPTIDLRLIRLWFLAQLLRLSGHQPNLQTDPKGNTLQAGSEYDFDYEAVAFVSKSGAPYSANNIKFLRFLFSDLSLEKVSQVEKIPQQIRTLTPLVMSLRAAHLHM